MSSTVIILEVRDEHMALSLEQVIQRWNHRKMRADLPYSWWYWTLSLWKLSLLTNRNGNSIHLWLDQEGATKFSFRSHLARMGCIIFYTWPASLSITWLGTGQRLWPSPLTPPCQEPPSQVPFPLHDKVMWWFHVGMFIFSSCSLWEA